LVEPSLPSDYNLWHRPHRKRPWTVAQRASSYKLAVHLIDGSGDWLILPRGERPDDKNGEHPHNWEVPKELPPRVTELSQVPVR
jgi:hypothetical protein